MTRITLRGIGILLFGLGVLHCGGDGSEATPTGADSGAADVAADPGGGADAAAPDAANPPDPGPPPDAGDPPDSGPDVEPDAGPPAPPMTPAGDGLAWVLAVVNDGGGLLSGADLDARFGRRIRHEVADDTIKNALKFWSQQHAPLELMGFEEGASEHTLIARITDRKGTWRRLRIAVESGPLRRIDGLSLALAPQLDPAIGMAGEGEIGILVGNPYYGGIPGGTAVELVDAATGEPFEPAIAGVADDTYAHVILTLPPGGDWPGVRATFPDGQVTSTYTSAPVATVPGFDWWVPAFPQKAFDDYVVDVGLERDESKAQLWGHVRWAPPADALTSWYGYNPDVGCATLALEPAATVYYSSSGNAFLPDPELAETDKRYSTYWGFNLEPTATTIGVDAGGDATMSFGVPLRAGEVTFALQDFPRDAFPTHPQRAGCQPQPLEGLWRAERSGSVDACSRLKSVIFRFGEAADGTLVVQDGVGTAELSCELAADGAFSCPSYDEEAGPPELLFVAMQQVQLHGEVRSDESVALSWELTVHCEDDPICDEYAATHGITWPCEHSATMEGGPFDPALTPMPEASCDEEESLAWVVHEHMALVSLDNPAAETRVVHILDAAGARLEIESIPPGGEAVFVGDVDQPLVVTDPGGTCLTILRPAAEGGVAVLPE